MVQVYSAAAVHAALPWEALSQALESAFVNGAQVPVRHVHPLSERDVMLLMPAWDERLIVTKLVTAIPGAPSTVCATVLAVDRATGEPLAVLDGEAVTLRRTAAASALAATRLARADASELLVVGSGRLAGWVARAHAALQPGLRRVRVWGRRAQPTAALAQALADEGLPAEPVAPGGLEAAVRAAHIVSCVTTSADPVVLGDWLSPGTHLDLVGGFRPDMREVDDAAVRHTRIVVDTRGGALAEAGDLVQPLREGVITPQAIVGDLAELLRGQCAGRLDSHGITLFKSVGTALEDLAATRLVLRDLLGARGAGRP
jgi:ornithine cyclodeaminase